MAYPAEARLEDAVEQVRVEDVEKFGCTKVCSRCSAVDTERCRRRFAGLLNDEARCKDAEKREQECDDRMRRRAKTRTRRPGRGLEEFLGAG